VLVLLATAALERAPGWWGRPGVRGTPTAGIGAVGVDAEAPEALSGLYRVQLERGHAGRAPTLSLPRFTGEGILIARLSRVEDAVGGLAEASADDATQLDAASLATPALRHILASRPRDIPPRVSLLQVSQPVVFASPDGPGVIR
jgi:hypothetical protein